MTILLWSIVSWLLVGFINSLVWQYVEDDWSCWGFAYISVLGPIGSVVSILMLRERITGERF